MTVKNEEGKTLEILKLNQFESRFQSMSVLVRDPESKNTYAFIKGAPERIYENSNNKPTNLPTAVKFLEMGGNRTIAIGFKVVLR